MVDVDMICSLRGLVLVESSRVGGGYSAVVVVGSAAAADTTPTATSSKSVSSSDDPSTVGVSDGNEAVGPDSA